MVPILNIPTLFSCILGGRGLACSSGRPHESRPFSEVTVDTHFTDNLAVTQEMKDTDKLWKVRPWLEKFQEPLKTIPLEEPLMRSWYLLKRSLASGSACGANPTPGGYGPEQLGAS